MPSGTAGHSEHFPGDKLTLEFRGAFYTEVFLLSHLWDCVSCHLFIIAVRAGVEEISDPVRGTALNQAFEALAKHGFSWSDHYIATVEPGHKVDVHLAGVAEEQFMARTGTAILIGQTRDLPVPRPEQGQDFTLVPTSPGYGPKEPHPATAERAGKQREPARAATRTKETTILLPLVLTCVTLWVTMRVDKEYPS
jgi:hypothetical protein